MKKILKSSKKSLILCTFLIALIVASCFSVPYVLAYFSVNQDLIGGATTPVFSFTPSYSNATKTTVSFGNDTDTMYISSSSISAGLNDMGASITPTQVTANCLVRVKLSIQLSNSTTVTTQTIKPLVSDLNISVDTKWIIASNSASISVAQDVAEYYLYYKGQIPASSTTAITVFSSFGCSDNSLDGTYILSNMYVEAIEASKNGAQKWLSGTVGSLGGWENTWYSSLGTLV